MADWKIAKCKYCGKEFVRRRHNQSYCCKECRSMAMWEKQSGIKKTLCWGCKNTNAYACPWFSDKGKPVPGWKATPTYVIMHSYNGKKAYAPQRSYIVHECPLFEFNR